MVCDEQERHWFTRDQKAVHKEARGKKGKKNGGANSPSLLIFS